MHLYCSILSDSCRGYLTKSYVCLALRSSYRRCSLTKGILRNFSKFTGKHLRLFFKKRLLHRCFPMIFSEIFKNTFFTERLRATASGLSFILKIRKNVLCTSCFSILWDPFANFQLNLLKIRIKTVAKMKIH